MKCVISIVSVAAIQNRATSANKKGPRKIAKIDQIYEEYCYFKKITTWKTKPFLIAITVHARERYFLRGPISDSTGGPFLSSANDPTPSTENINPTQKTEKPLRRP